jgi:hypothetical protein
LLDKAPPAADRRSVIFENRVTTWRGSTFWVDLSLSDMGVPVPMIDRLVPQAKEIVFVLGAGSDPCFPAIVEEAPAELTGLRVFPTLNLYIGNLSDHHSFEKQGRPPLPELPPASINWHPEASSSGVEFTQGETTHRS